MLHSKCINYINSIYMKEAIQSLHSTFYFISGKWNHMQTAQNLPLDKDFTTFFAKCEVYMTKYVVLNFFTFKLFCFLKALLLIGLEKGCGPYLKVLKQTKKSRVKQNKWNFILPSTQKLTISNSSSCLLCMLTNVFKYSFPDS